MKTVIITDHSIIKKARQLAVALHHKNGQFYGHHPYAYHLELVYQKSLQYIYYIDKDKRSDVLSAAYCHDLIEDTPLAFKEFMNETNYRIARIVLDLSNELGQSRKEQFFKTVPKIWANDLAAFVKIADRIVNTNFSKKNSFDKYSRYLNEYPVFRYALKTDLYEKMWEELDNVSCFHGENNIKK